MNNLTALSNQSIAVNIVSKFAENKLKANSETLHRLLSLYTIKLKFGIKEALIKWNIKTMNLMSTAKCNPANYETNKIINSNYNRPNNNYYNSYNDNNSLNSDKQFYGYKKRTKSSNKSNSHSNIENFIQRQEDFIENKTKKKDKLVKHNEDEYQAVYTFSPNISLTHSGNISEANKSAYLRLYEDSTRRKVDYNKKVNAFVQQMKTKSNQNKPPRSVIDKGKIEQLYNDYKTRQKKRRTLINQIDNENGVTFKPNITSSPFYKKVINTNIHDRTKKTIENKNNFIAKYNFIHEQEIKQLERNRIRKRSLKK